jgi:hypothetical protein
VCAQHAAKLGVENRLMPRELVASVLPVLDNNNYSFINLNKNTKLHVLIGRNILGSPPPK